MAVRDLTASDLLAWGWGETVSYADIFGYTVLDGDEIIAIGGLWLRDDGKVWVVFDSHGKPPRTVHKCGVKLIRTAQDAGIGAVYTIADEHIEGSVEWISRFGFRPDGKNAEGETVWRLELGKCAGDRWDGPRRDWQVTSRLTGKSCRALQSGSG